jgi:TatD DNase family protein
MQIIDSHTHIYLSQFDNDRAAMLQRAYDAGVKRFYLPAIDSETTERMLQLESAFPEKCFAMMGLHPCSVTEKYKAELDWVEKWLEKRPFAAVGEIGLDFYWDTTWKDQQFEAFRVQIEWALQYKLPINIHTRNAMQATIDVVNEYKGRGLTGIFHCFGDGYEVAKQVLDAGFYLGIGGVVTYKNAGLAETLFKVPLDRLVVETDAPYLTPVPFRGKRNECSYLKYVIEKLGDIYGLTPEHIGDITSANALAVYAL